MHNISLVISNMVNSRREVPQHSHFGKLYEDIWNNYIDIQQKNIQVILLMFLYTQGYNSLGDQTRNLKEKHVLKYKLNQKHQPYINQLICVCLYVSDHIWHESDQN